MKRSMWGKAKHEADVVSYNVDYVDHTRTYRHTNTHTHSHIYAYGMSNIMGLLAEAQILKSAIISAVLLNFN